MKHSLEKMSCLDVYLSSLSSTEYQAVKSKIKPSTKKLMPLKSWDVYMEQFHKSLKEFKVDLEMKLVKDFAKKFNWKNNVNQIFNESDYDAIILTDHQQKIIWVNEGFSKMTGYSKSYAIHKTPRFLQGEETSEEMKLEIKKSLATHQSFKNSIKNYKKDGTVYNCEIKIIPLHSINGVSHYMALEKEIS